MQIIHLQNTITIDNKQCAQHFRLERKLKKVLEVNKAASFIKETEFPGVGAYQYSFFYLESIQRQFQKPIKLPRM